MIRAWLLFGALAACGGDGSSSTAGQPLPTSEATALCQDYCAHAVQCGWTSNAADCQSGCLSASSMLFRGDGLRPWLDCEIAAACSTANVGEVCYVEAVGGLAPRPLHEQYVTKCTALTTTCPGIVLPGPKVCEVTEVEMFSDPYMTAHVLPCFDLACAQIGACLDANVLNAF